MNCVIFSIVVEPGDIIREAEQLAPEERIRRGEHERLFKWVKGDFRSKLADLIPQKGLRRDKQLSELANNFARVLDLFVIDGVHFEWDKKLTEAVFGSSADSVINCLDREKSQKVKIWLMGPISTLTLLDLIKAVRPGLKDELKVSEVVTDAQMDVVDKIDLTFRFGDKNQQSQEILRVVQLKTIPENDVRIARAYEDDIKTSYFDKVPGEDVRKMINRGKSIADAQNAQLRAYVVLVPAYDASVVGNIYGIIRHEHRDARGLIEAFREDALGEGFLPP